MIAVAQDALEHGHSVRTVERAVKARVHPPLPAPEPSEAERARSVIIRDLEDRLRRGLGVKVHVKTDARNQGSGTIEVPYGNLDELDRLLQSLLPADLRD